MLVGVNQRLYKMVVVLGQHVVALTEGKLAHDVVREIREPPRHILVRTAKGIGIAELLAEQLDFVDNDRLVRSNGSLAHGVGDDPAFPRMDSLVGCTR